MAHINLIPGDQGVRLSTLSPKYLHTNSTSHTWPFSAIAELIDNAYDPDVDASQLWIDVERYGFEQCLVFTDNGAGMDSLKLHKMLSFGFCEKVAKNDHLPVGHYGNGFKSGSMRLGKDALVFTKSSSSRSVGFLSQTYLEAVEAQTILVPIVSWDAEDNMVERADGDKALQDILTHSLFKNKNDLMQQFNKIKSSTGTRIIISNMRRTQEGKYEFDFRISPDDIRIPDDVELENNKYKRQERQNHIPESDYSLRAYCSILYLKPRMQIILRGKKVKTTVITKSLSKTEVDTYKPQGVFKPIKVTFGFSQNKNHYGIMMYHRNRLIKPYVRVGYQLKANNLGVGVIGVIQCDYLQPTHNKQDFDYTKAFRSSMSALGSKLNDYWNEKKGKTQINSNAPIPEPKEVESVPDQLWVQCDNPECLKWRKLPPSVTSESLPEKWYCSDHPEEQWRSCDVPEELEEEAEDSVQPYVKKQKKRIERELEEKKRRENEAKRIKERELEIRSQQLKQKEKEFEKLMQSVKKKGQQQQQQQKQNEAIKKETASPQKSQGKNETVTVPLVKVKQEAQRGETSLADAAQEVCQQLSTTVQKQPIMETPSSLNKVSDLKRHHEPTNEGPSARKIKTEDDVIIIDDPPSPSPDNKTNGQRSDSSFDASLPNMDIGTPNKGAPNDDSSSNMAASLPSTEASIPNKGALSPNKDIAEHKVEEIANVPSMINIDKDIIEEIKLMSPQQQLQALVTRTQQLKQLYSLRENVLKLLQVLVPELEVSEFKGKYQDKTIDDLLQQVLEQAEKSDPIEIDS